MSDGLGSETGLPYHIAETAVYRSVPESTLYLNENHMKNIGINSVFVVLILGSITVLNSCKKDQEQEKEPTSPVLTTGSVSGISQTGAVSGGNITKDGGSEVTARGVCWSTTQNPTIASDKTTEGTGIGTFLSNLTDLSPNTTYYVRAYATNSIGTSYGNEVSFSTSPVVLSLTTNSVNYITIVSALVDGGITTDGSINITDMGFCWDTKSNPTIASDHNYVGEWDYGFVSTIAGLLPGTTYYVRSYATNSTDTTYGNVLSFTTRTLQAISFNPDLTYGSVSDIEGNVYKTIVIGTQTWMAENLKSTKYNNGDLIGTTTPAILDITAEAAPKYQWSYDSTESLVATYGRLYTSYAVNDSRRVCPTGWHIPTDEEWRILRDFLGGNSVSGAKLKESGLVNWSEPNADATNETGFTAIPGGYRDAGYGFTSLAYGGIWWSSTYYDVNTVWVWSMYNSTGDIVRGVGDEHNGYSVRCVKD